MAQLTLGTSAAITPALSAVNGTPTALSTDVAAHFGKRHDNVVRDIEALLQELPADRLLNFEETVTDRPNPAGGAPIQSRAYRLTRDGFTLLAMGFTGKKALAFKLAYLDAFNRMEAELAGRAMGHTPSGEPVFNVTAKELDALVEQRVKQHWLGKVALEALPRKRLDAEWDEYNQILDEAGKLALAAERFMQASQQMAAHAVLAGECIGQVATLRARAMQRRDGVGHTSSLAILQGGAA